MENKPEKKFRAGAISATVWSNEGTNQQGQPTSYRTISFDRSYKDKNGEWRSTNHLRTTDIPKAVLVLNKAFEFVSLSNEEATV
ncbi:MAG: hypothetical protein ACE5DM_00985 [Candidatus Nanoarchaeia archaeon]